MVGILIVAVLILMGFLGYNTFLSPETPSSQETQDPKPTQNLNPVKAVKTTEKVRDQMQDFTQQQQNRVDQVEKEIN